MKFTVALLAPLVWVAAWGQVTTQHNDIFRSGQNTNEVLLTPSNVNVNRFGKLVSVAMDGYVVAQPLYVPQVTVTGGTLHNVVFVATQHDSVFALDAESGNLLWSTSLIPRGGSTVPITVQGCGASTGYTEVGVMGTPVIERSSNTLYVVAKTLENNSSVFRLHALDVGTGRERLGGSVVISASVVSGTTQVTFNPAKQLQRPGLLLANGNVYLAFGSNGCDIDATGWIMAYHAATLQQVGVFNPDPDQTSGGSIWQSGKGVAADGVGNIYFATANGAFDVSLGDCGECVMKLGSSLTPSDYFSPADRDYLDTQDFDLGSGGVLLLPDQANPPHYLLVAAGKEGTVYLLNRNNLGQFNASGDQVVQELPGGLPQVDGGGTGAAYWNNNIYFASTKGLRMFRLSNGTLSAVSIPKSASAISGKGLPSVSANGTTNGIVWVLGGPTYLSPQLAAYDATQLASLYTSSAAANGRDTLSPTAHFATPTIAKGRVYVGTQSQLVIYGLLPMLKVWFGNNQSGSAGTTLPNPIEVKAVGAYSGSVLPNITVTFSDNGAGGTFSNPTAITDSNGIALTTYTLPSTPGTVKISASAARFASAQFTEIATD